MALSVFIVSTGHEVLRGETVDTNAAWLSRAATECGATVVGRMTVGDLRVDLEDAIEHAIDAADAVVVTGGLGPTEDDRTREAIASVLGVPIDEDEDAWRMVAARFTAVGKTPEPIQRRQARLPQGAVPLRNDAGTAPGLWIAAYSSVLVAALPGPPREMRAMFEAEVLPRWRATHRLEETELRVVWTAGAPESEIARAIDDLMRAPEPTVGTHPDDGEVAVRILARGGKAAARADATASEIVRRLGAAVVSVDEDVRLAAAVLARLHARGEVVATAESITGGLVARMLVAVPSSSAAFRGGFVAYSDEWKSDRLGVPASLLAEHGAVSEPAALAMARAAREQGRCAWGLATTGVAGPGPDDRGVPEGTAFVALSGARGDQAKRLQLGPPRESVQRRTAVAALDLLRRALAGA